MQIAVPKGAFLFKNVQAAMTVLDLCRLVFFRHDTTPVVQEVSREDVLRLIDEQAQLRRGISGAELLCAYRAGRLDNPGELADILVYSDLLSPADTVFESVSPRPAEAPRLGIR